MSYKVHSKLRNTNALGLLMRITGRKIHAANPDYVVQNAVYNRFLEGDLIADELLLTDNRRQKQLLDIICNLANERKSGKLVTPDTVDEVRTFITENQSRMTVNFLDRIEQISTASGLLVLAHAIHKINQQLVLLHTSNKTFCTKRDLSRLFWAYADRGQYPAAGEIYSKLRNPTGAMDEAYYQHIKNKRIAIVGPSSSGIDHTEEILRDFDIIITMNYSGIKTPVTETLEPGCHISYYNGRMTDKITTPGTEISFLEDIDYAVVKPTKVNDRFAVSSYTKVRDTVAVKGLFLRGAPNLLQVILMDLTHFTPASVKAFYMNIGLSEVLHDKDYLKSLNRKDLTPRDQWRSLAKHNHIYQYDYTKYLFETGFLQADTRLNEVLNLGTAEFMRQMEELENKKEKVFMS